MLATVLVSVLPTPQPLEALLWEAARQLELSKTHTHIESFPQCVVSHKHSSSSFSISRWVPFPYSRRKRSVVTKATTTFLWVCLILRIFTTRFGKRNALWRKISKMNGKYSLFCIRELLYTKCTSFPANVVYSVFLRTKIEVLRNMNVLPWHWMVNEEKLYRICNKVHQSNIKTF